MSLEIMKYCLVALLSQDAEQQSQEISALLEDKLDQSQLVSCLQAYGAGFEATSNSLVENAMNSGNTMGTFVTGEGGRPSLEDLQ